MILKSEYLGSNLILALICCRILDKSLNLFVLEFLHLLIVIIIIVVHHSAVMKVKWVKFKLFRGVFNANIFIFYILLLKYNVISLYYFIIFYYYIVFRPPRELYLSIKANLSNFLKNYKCKNICNRFIRHLHVFKSFFL